MCGVRGSIPYGGPGAGGDSAGDRDAAPMVEGDPDGSGMAEIGVLEDGAGGCPAPDAAANDVAAAGTGKDGGGGVIADGVAAASRRRRRSQNGGSGRRHRSRQRQATATLSERWQRA